MTLPAMRRISVAILAFGLLALAGFMAIDLLNCDRAIIASEPTRHAAEAYSSMYQSVRPLLPTEGVVRFISDAPRDETRVYYMSRFVLAPVRLAWDGDYDTALGVFASPRNVEPVLRREGYVIEKDMGHGVFLLKKGRR